MALPDPITRQETYLSAIANFTGSENLPEPITREEQYLYAIAQNGGGSGEITSYNQLQNKPQINGVELVGNKTTDDLDLAYDDTEVKADITNLDTRVTDLENQEPDVNVSKTVTGNPIHIEDAADAPIVSGEITFEPVQDLHGYDKPWVGGAGKNKLHNTASTLTTNGITFTVNADGSVNANGTATANAFLEIANYYLLESGTYIVNGSSNNDAVIIIRDGYVAGSQLATSPAGSGTSEFTMDGSNTIGVIIRVPSGAVLNNVKLYPMIRLATETDPTFEPYSNICPITGYTDCEVEVTGKNLIDPDNLGHTTYSTTGEAESTLPNFTSTTNLVKVVSGDSYILSKDGIMATARKFFYDNSGTFISTTFGNTAFTIPNNASYMRFHTGDYSGSLTGWQLESGSTATTYEPYQSTTYTIDLDGTRYGGTLDVDSGVMSVDKGFGTYDGSSDEDWFIGGSASNPRFTLNADLGIKNVAVTEKINAISSYYPIVTANNTYLGTTGISTESANSARLTVFDSQRKNFTVAEWKTYLASNPLQVCYELATPITVQLTPEQIRTLKGTNNISTNMTDMSLEYITQDYQPLVDLAEDTLMLAKEYTDEQIALLKKLPTYPSEDGTYTLSLTVADGVGTLSWV